MTGQERRDWALNYMRRAPEAATYGSPEWIALPDGPEKVAAVVRAAECWWVDGELAAERLELERVRGLWLAKRAEDEQRTRRSDQHRETWRRWPDPAIDAEVEDDWLRWIGGVA